MPRGVPGRVAATCHPARSVNATVEGEGLCIACYRRHRYRTNPEYRERMRAHSRRAMRFKGTEWTHEKFAAALEAQAGRCAICGRQGGEALHADHDHETGALRGLLCSQCNTALGLLADDEQRLAAAAEYIRRYHGQR